METAALDVHRHLFYDSAVYSFNFNNFYLMLNPLKIITIGNLSISYYKHVKSWMYSAHKPF